MFKKHTRGEFDKKERKMVMNYNALAVHTTSKQVSLELKDWFLEEMEKNKSDNKKPCPSLPPQTWRASTVKGKTQLIRPLLQKQKQKASSGSGSGTRLEEKSFEDVNEKTKSLFRPNVLTLMQRRILAQRRTLSTVF